ncbi:glycosyltransferase [uncultured Maribacter sp.]|uniref:glycosyltransferase n=1 Tax=uncultured Maribacter sp. TaxID=431308 RepID=UPI0026246078|nr:glycosyltransferase [uncultured Maribacter sp.]
MQLPKVLILNQPFVTNTGGGITMSNLFSGWDKDKLAVTCLGHILTKEIDPEICNNYYQLGHEERKWIFPFNLFSRKYESGIIKFNTNTKDKVIAEDTKSKSRISFLNNYMNPFLNYLGISHMINKIVLSEKFKKWLDDYNPDVVYAQCSSRESILFCIAIKKYLNKPYIFHMMDDWPSLIGIKGFMSNYWKKKIDLEFKTLLDITDIHLGISDYMSEAYKKRYGKDFVTYHNPINLDFWQKGQKQNYNLSKKPTILYAGRIGLGIDSSLKSIAKAIEIVNNDLNLSIEFQIQSQTPPPWISNYKHVIHKLFVPYNKLPNEFGNTDFLILPYDFSPKSLAYIKYSMPTKASEYMASGAPILIYAPLETALVQYAEKSSWASIVTEQNITQLAKEIKKLVLDKTYRKKLSETAKNLAMERHDTKIVARRFQKTIIEAAE